MEKNKPKDKTWFDVKVEALLPATILYKVLAEDAQEASELIKNMAPGSVVYRLNGRKEIKLTVYDMGCSVIKFMKNLVGVLR